MPVRAGSRRKRVDLVGILEAAYQVEQPEEPWLTGVLDAARSGLDDGFGAYAFTYDAANPSTFGFRHLVSRDVMPAMLDVLRTAAQTVPADLVETSIWSQRASTMSEMAGWETFSGFPLRFDADHVANDAIGINALDPSRVSCLLGAYWQGRQGLSERERMTWNRISTHLAASFRLQRALQSRENPVPAEAVLSPSGRVLHAELPAQERAVRDSLSEACQSIERARTRKGRADGEISVSLWRSLVSERWSLVDTYERDGKRFVVARRNDVQLPSPNALSPRERQALSFAVLGDSNKLIAYELGISASTVGVLLHRAAQKLGCDSRAELLARFRELAATATDLVKPN